MEKGKINKEINIEEMIKKYPDFGDLLTELIKQQKPKKKNKSNKKSRQGEGG